MHRIWKKIRHWLEVRGMELLVAGLPRLSRTALLQLANFAGGLVFACDRRGRAVALANLEIAFGDSLLPSQKREIARQSYGNLARTFFDLFWAINLTEKNFRDWVEIRGLEHFEGPPDGGQGRLFYGAHFGNFEWLSLISGLLGRPATTIGQEIKNPAITPFFQKARSAFGNQPIPQKRAVLRFLKVLKRGGNCGILVDLTLKLDQPGHLIDSFCRKKWVTGVHVNLTQIARARLLPVACLPLADGRYEFRVLPPMAVPQDSTEQDLTQRCWDELEKMIRERPECYLWNYKHWRYRPENAENYPFYAQSGEKFQKILESRYSE